MFNYTQLLLDEPYKEETVAHQIMRSLQKLVYKALTLDPVCDLNSEFLDLNGIHFV